MNDNDKDIERRLKRIEDEENVILAEEDLILEAVNSLKPKLRFIKFAIGGIMPVGPATLTVGDKKTLSVLGFDQNGAAFPIDFTANPVTFTDDNEAVLAD